MSDIIAWSVVAGVLAAILGGLAWLASRTRRRGVGREIMGPVDLIYRPHTHEINIQIQVREESVLPMPSADDQHP